MNNLDEKVITFSVREGIEFCIENKIKGALEQLESFDKNRKLATNQKKKLKANLECLANEVIITGGGRSGLVILKGLKATPTERITGNSKNGRQLSDEDETMKEYLFSSLCSNYSSFEVSRKYTVNQLEKLTNLMPISREQSEKIETEMTSIFRGYSEENIISQIRSNARRNLESRLKVDVKLYINHLVAEGRIYLENKHIVKYLEDSFVISMMKVDFEDVSLYHIIDENIINKIKEEITKIAEANDFTYKTYVQAANRFIKIDKKVQKMLDEVKAYFEDNGYDYVFITNDITILRPETAQKVKKKEAREAFEQKIIRLTNERMMKEKYHNQTQYTKEFYRLAMFVLLRNLNVDGLDGVIIEEINKIPNKLHKVNKQTFELITAQENKDKWITDDLITCKADSQNSLIKVVEEKVVEEVEEVKIEVVNKTLSKEMQEEFDYLKRARGNNKKDIKKTIRSELILDEEQLKQLERISEIAREDYLKNGDTLSAQWEAEESKQTIIEAKRKEAKRLKAITSLPFGSTFNKKPAEYMMPFETFMEYEPHTIEEIEQIRLEN